MPTTNPILMSDNETEVVLGVDTHRDEHVGAVLTSIGAVLATPAFSTTAVRYSELLFWARSFGMLCCAALESNVLAPTGRPGRATFRQQASR